MGSTKRIIELGELLDQVNEVASSSLTSRRKIKKAAKVVDRANEILAEVIEKDVCMDTVAADVAVVQSATSLIGHEIDTCKSSLSEYNPDQLAASIKEKVDSLHGNWLSLFDVKMLGNSFIPRSVSLFATFNPDERPPPKEKQRRQRMDKNNDIVLTCPESIEKSEQMEETSSILRKIEKILQRAFFKRNKKPLNYFEVVVDPHDFGRTIDNIFQVSFLIRDHAMALSYEDNHLWLSPLEKKKHKDPSDKDGDTEEGEETKKPDVTTQSIIQLDMSQWRGLIKKYKIKKPFIDIPDRYEEIAPNN